MAIRLGTEEDVSSVCALEALAFPDPWSETDVAAHRKEAHLCFLVFEEEGEVRGYLLGSCIPPEGEIFRVASHPSFRRRGIAEALCTEFFSLCEITLLEVRRSNLAARALYEKLGFSLVGERRSYYKDPTEDACLYRRE